MFRVARQSYREGTQGTTAGLAFLAYQNLLTNDPLTKKGQLQTQLSVMLHWMWHIAENYSGRFECGHLFGDS